MLRQEQLQQRKQRSREDSVPTFPPEYRRANGKPGGETEDIRDEIDEILAENTETRSQLGHLGIEAA